MFAGLDPSVLQFKAGLLVDAAYCDETLARFEAGVRALPRGDPLSAGTPIKHRGAYRPAISAPSSSFRFTTFIAIAIIDATSVRFDGTISVLPTFASLPNSRTYCSATRSCTAS